MISSNTVKTIIFKILFLQNERELHEPSKKLKKEQSQTPSKVESPKVRKLYYVILYYVSFFFSSFSLGLINVFFFF